MITVWFKIIIYYTKILKGQYCYVIVRINVFL